MSLHKIFIGVGLNEYEISLSLARSSVYLRTRGQENPLYPMLADLLEKMANEKFTSTLKRKDALPSEE
jgi:hypothetical protein